MVNEFLPFGELGADVLDEVVQVGNLACIGDGLLEFSVVAIGLARRSRDRSSTTLLGAAFVEAEHSTAAGPLMASSDVHRHEMPSRSPRTNSVYRGQAPHVGKHG